MWFYDSMIFCDQFHVANRRICSSTIGDVEVVETSQRSGSRTLELLRSLDWWRRIGVGTLLQTNISHLWKRNIIDSQLPLKGDMSSFPERLYGRHFFGINQGLLGFQVFCKFNPKLWLNPLNSEPRGDFEKKGVKEQKTLLPPTFAVVFFDKNNDAWK